MPPDERTERRSFRRRRRRRPRSSSAVSFRSLTLRSFVLVLLFGVRPTRAEDREREVKESNNPEEGAASASFLPATFSGDRLASGDCSTGVCCCCGVQFSAKVNGSVKDVGKSEQE